MLALSQRSVAALLIVGLALPTLAVTALPAGSTPQPAFSGPVTFNQYPSPSHAYAGETSIGINPHTNNAMFSYTGGSSTNCCLIMRIHWDDGVSPPKATWTDVTPPTDSSITVDPGLWTDRASGKTYSVQNIILGSNMAMTQGLTNPVDGSTILNDGDQWVPTQPPVSFPFFDHQTVGGGPHATAAEAGIGVDPNQVVNSLVPGLDQVTGQADALYYCSQLGLTMCQRSDDDGVTWGPYVPINANDDCGSLTGHVQVDHIGNVYVPIGNSGSGKKCIEISRTNGLVWETHKLAGTVNSQGDPDIAIGNDDRVWVGMTNGGLPMVSWSDDHGATFTNPVFIAPQFPTLANTEFSMMVAGSPGRAAMAWYGTTTAGNDQAASFPGVWHLYVSFTFDGGKTWTAYDTTPNDPVQVGCIWLGGGGNACRNLLDFQGATLDAQGRVVVGYADGCTPQRCGPNGGDSFGTIARQTTGKTLYAQFDG